jgi:hypothetical protein
LGSLRQEVCEFQGSLGYLLRPCLKKQTPENGWMGGTCQNYDAKKGARIKEFKNFMFSY